MFKFMYTNAELIFIIQILLKNIYIAEEKERERKREIEEIQIALFKENFLSSQPTPIQVFTAFGNRRYTRLMCTPFFKAPILSSSLMFLLSRRTKIRICVVR